MKKISIIVPCYNESAGLDNLYQALLPLIDNRLPMDGKTYEWEVVLVDDGSSDSSLDVMARLRSLDPRISYLSLSRNFGKESAMLAGLDYSTGDCVVIIDADLQHPVSAIPAMIAKWEEGYDDVFGRRLSRGREPWLRRKLSMMFYGILSRTSRLDTFPNVGDFRLLDRRCVNELCAMRESQRYTKGLYSWIGYRKAEVPFETADRATGSSSFGFIRLANLAVDGITSHTTAPLRLATLLGTIVALASIVYLIYIFINTLLYGDPVAGYPTLICVILFLGGCQLLSLGIIGEYIGRIFIESKRRPPYIASVYNGQKISRPSYRGDCPPDHGVEGRE